MRFLLALFVGLALVGCASTNESKTKTGPMTNDGTMKVNPPESDPAEEKTPDKPAETTTAKQSFIGIWTAQAEDDSGTHTYELHLEEGGSAVLHIATVNPDKEPVSHQGTWHKAHAAVSVSLQSTEQNQALDPWMLRFEGTSLASETQPKDFGPAKLVFTRSAG